MIMDYWQLEVSILMIIVIIFLMRFWLISLERKIEENMRLGYRLKILANEQIKKRCDDLKTPSDNYENYFKIK